MLPKDVSVSRGLSVLKPKLTIASVVEVLWGREQGPAARPGTRWDGVGLEKGHEGQNLGAGILKNIFH